MSTAMKTMPAEATSTTAVAEKSMKWFCTHQAELQRDFEVMPGLTWIEVQWSPFGVGCCVCRAQSSSTTSKKSGTDWEQFGIQPLRKQSFERHAESTTHQRNLQKLGSLCDDAGQNDSDGVRVPSAKDAYIKIH